jgi:NADP-dependent aldehyde dehydrogenase
MISGKNHIGSKVSSNGKNTFHTFNPKSNKNTEWTFYEASHSEIDEAVDLAKTAFQEYKQFSGAKKAGFLRAIAEEIENLGDALIDAYTQESGLPEVRAIGERGRTMGQLNAFAALLEEGSWTDATIDTAIPDRTPIPKEDIRKMLVPIGPIVVFGSSNFPLAFSTAGGDTASALAAGCPVIVKSHPMHSGTGELVASAIIKAAERTGMPNGVFSNLNSSGIEVGEKLVTHPKVKGVGFTGSIRGGTALYNLGTQRDEPIPVFAEMGSVNPVVILPSALENKKDHWASQYAASITLGAGQFCTNPGLLIGIKGEALDSFITTLGEQLSALEPTSMLHPNIHENYEKGRKEISSHEKVSVAGMFQDELPPNHGRQQLLTVSGSDFLANPVMHQEVFGPLSLVVQCDNEAELTKTLNCLEGQLTGTVLGDESDVSKYENVIDALVNKVGRIIFNSVPTGVEVCPSMFHGGPFPSTTDNRFSSVGTSAIIRWVRPVCFQNGPKAFLPAELQNENPLGIMRKVNGKFTTDAI